MSPRFVVWEKEDTPHTSERSIKQIDQAAAWSAHRLTAVLRAGAERLLEEAVEAEVVGPFLVGEGPWLPARRCELRCCSRPERSPPRSVRLAVSRPAVGAARSRRRICSHRLSSNNRRHHRLPRWQHLKAVHQAQLSPRPPSRKCELSLEIVHFCASLGPAYKTQIIENKALTQQRYRTESDQVLSPLVSMTSNATLVIVTTG